MIREHFKSQSRRIVSAADRCKLKISNVLIRSYSIIKHMYMYIYIIYIYISIVPLNPFGMLFKSSNEVQLEFDRTRIRFVPLASSPPLPSSWPVEITLEVDGLKLCLQWKTPGRRRAGPRPLPPPQLPLLVREPLVVLRNTKRYHVQMHFSVTRCII